MSCPAWAQVSLERRWIERRSGLRRVWPGRTGPGRDGVPCPSAARPEQNRHRLADGWQASAVRAILENPRYTGYAVFGRWVKQEVLADPDDVAAGHVTKFRRASVDRIVRSRTQAQPAIVSVETFTEVQLLRRSKGAGGLESRAKLERGPKATKRVYALRGRVRCGHCQRRMEGTPRENRIYYRCAARSIVPGSPILATHPKNIYLPENAVLPHLNDWIGGLLTPKNRDATVAALAGAQPDATTNTRTEPLRQRIKDAETRLRRLQAAIEAGANPTALVDALNRAEAERDAARTELDALPSARTTSATEVHAMIDYLDTIGRQVNDASPAKLQELYTALDLELLYNAEDRMLDVSIRSAGRGSKRVRGGT
ncbi:recombinase family protein [Actinokineospora diospyrosa]|uniref:recombinase family protein n=1 Tax=Actinokineospora diospyrosa TaxID=103728 RepID=UPI0020A2E7F1|nr:recombinase family protein [Actinokineospora diospyrosa]